MRAAVALLAADVCPVTEDERNDYTYQLDELESQWSLDKPQKERFKILDECIALKHRIGIHS